MSLTIDLSGTDNGATSISVINCSDLQLTWSPSYDEDGNCYAGYAGNGAPFSQSGGSPYIPVDGDYGPISPVFTVICVDGQFGLEIDFSDGNNLFTYGGFSVTAQDCCTTTFTLDGTTHALDDDASTALWIDSVNVAGTISFTVQNNHCCNNGGGCQIGVQVCDGTCASNSSGDGMMGRRGASEAIVSEIVVPEVMAPKVIVPKVESQSKTQSQPCQKCRRGQ